MTDERPHPAFETVRELLSRAVTAAEMAELDLPHIVVCADVGTGLTTYSGPFADALAALSFAEEEAALDGSVFGESDLRYSVAALYPPERADP